MKKYDYSKKIAEIDYSKEIKTWKIWGYITFILSIINAILNVIFSNELVVLGFMAASVGIFFMSIALFMGASGFKKNEIKNKQELQDLEDKHNKEWEWEIIKRK